MRTASILIMFGGYAVASYGYILLAGWDIGWIKWVDPLNPYQWPTGGNNPSMIAGSQVFPGLQAG